MKYWVISDTHYHHRMLVEHNYRPEGFEGLIAKHWREMVKPEDLVIHLGDVVVGRDGEAHDVYVRPMPGKKILVRGNHDSRSLGWYMGHGWDFCCDSFSIDYAGKRVLFTHIPDHNTPCDINVHGHLHAIPEQSHRRAEIMSFYKERHVLVAMELTKYRPLLLDTIVAQHAKRQRPISDERKTV